MPGTSVNRLGESLPIFNPITSNSIQLDGTAGHAESAALPEGNYRLAVKSSVNNAGVMVEISDTPVVTTTTGMWLAQSWVEYFFIPEGSKISVINGLLNITKIVA